MALSDYTRASATAGVHRFEFEEVAGFIDSESLDSTYWSASIENDLNDRLTHNVTVGSGASIGVSSNYVETSQAAYETKWKVFDETIVTGGVNFQRSTESGGLLKEEIESVQYRVGLRQQITEHTALGVNFSHYQNESDLTKRDYDQQRLQVYCTVDINDKLELRASYQRWDVDSQDDSSFTQNSATLGLTFHF